VSERTKIIVRREPLVDKVCPVCGTSFVGLGRRRYCSRACAARADYHRHLDARRAAKREREGRRRAKRAP
jgi:hypothetical protein